MLLYLFTIGLAFYILPIFIKDAGSEIAILFLLIPFLLFILSLIYGYRHGFDIQFSLIIAILFMPTIFIFYDFSYSKYIIIYALIAFVGHMMGWLIALSGRDNKYL